MATERQSIRVELEPALNKISYEDLLSIAGFELSADSSAKDKTPCYRRGGRHDRSEAKILLMNKNQKEAHLYDPRDEKAYDKFSFIYEYKEEFFGKFPSHAWGNDFTRLKDVIRNMANMPDSEPMQKAKQTQDKSFSEVKPFEPDRWYTKPLMESPKAAPQQLYLTRDRGLSKETLMVLGTNILAISDMLKFKAPNKKRLEEINKILENIPGLDANKKEAVISFIQGMQNIDTHFDNWNFKQDIIEKLSKEEGLSEVMLQPIIHFGESCTPFAINRTQDSNIAAQLREFSSLLKEAGLTDESIANYSNNFRDCFFEQKLQKTLLNLSSTMPESFIQEAHQYIDMQLKALPNTVSLSDIERMQISNFIDNIHSLNLQDAQSYQKILGDRLKCLIPEGVYNFSPEYKPIAIIRNAILNKISELRQQPALKAAAEIRKLVKNPMYKTINIGFAAKDYLTHQIKGYEVKCVNRAVKVNVSGSDFMNNFVYFGQEDRAKVKHCYLFESSIDAASFFELQPLIGKPINLQESVLISCAGVPKSKHIPLIKELFPDAQVHLCLDRDLAGKKASIIANCQLQGLTARFTLTDKHEKVTIIPESEKWDENKYPKKGREKDAKTGQLIYKENIEDKYDINVKGEINGKPYNKTLNFSTDEISVQAFHERFPEVKKVAQYHIPTIAYRGQVGKLEFGGEEVAIPTKDWNEMIVAPKEVEKRNREFTKNLMEKRNKEKTVNTPELQEGTTYNSSRRK